MGHKTINLTFNKLTDPIAVNNCTKYYVVTTGLAEYNRQISQCLQFKAFGIFENELASV